MWGSVPGVKDGMLKVKVWSLMVYVLVIIICSLDLSLKQYFSLCFGMLKNTSWFHSRIVKNSVGSHLHHANGYFRHFDG